MSLLFLQTDFGLFIGHLHPLFVHLPIGFLLLAGIFYYLGRQGRYHYLNKALPIILGLSTISAILAAFFGWLLAKAGGYEESTLFWHRWLGIGVAIFSLIAWLWSVNMLGGNKKVPAWMMAILVGLLFVTGHQGGNLTHGQDYLLNNAPTFIQKMFGTKQVAKINLIFPENPDSTFLYAHLLQPTFEQKCYSCHNEETQRGKLDMSTKEALLKGGAGGPVLVKKEPSKSEIFHRVSMNPKSRKFMPIKGVPLTYQEVRLLDFWIANGLSFDMAITDKKIPEDIKTIIEEHFGASTKKIAFVNRQKVTAAMPQDIATIQTAGFTIAPLAADNNFIDVSFRGTLTKEKLAALAPIKEQLTWLNLANTGVQDDWLSLLSDFPNLTRLRLEQNEISDKGIAALKDLQHLYSLNLYGTKVGDDGIIALQNCTSLEKIFLWQTEVTAEGVEALQNKLPGLSINIGSDLVLKKSDTK